MLNPFTLHPYSIGETYWQHMKFAVKCGFRLIVSGIACIVHSVFPFLFETTASNNIAKLHCITKTRLTDASVPHSMWQSDEHEDGVEGYMCLTDYELELGAAKGGNGVYPSVSDLRENLNCIDECGIAKVRVVGEEIVQPPRDYAERE